MFKEFLKQCLDIAKEEYFETDHHGYTDKDEEWNTLIKNMNRDFFDEWISDIIFEQDDELWYACDKFMLYMAVKTVAEEV